MTSGTDPKGNQISYVYDKNYQQVKATDAKGNTITYKYDSMGRVIEESKKILEQSSMNMTKQEI